MNFRIKVYIDQNYYKYCHGSNIYSILKGESTFRNSINLTYQEKCIFWGHHMEKKVKKALERTFSIDILDCPQFDYKDFIKSIPDGMIIGGINVDSCLLEIKCPLSVKGVIEHPLEYYTQTQTHMICTGFTNCLVIYWYPTSFIINLIELDKILGQDEIIPRCRKYSKNIKQDPIQDEIIIESRTKHTKKIIEYTKYIKKIFDPSFFKNPIKMDNMFFFK